MSYNPKNLILKETHCHSFHIVEERPWPLICSFNAINIIVRIITYFNYPNGFNVLITHICFFIIIISIFIWWRDAIREGTLLGYHTSNVIKGFKYRIIIFILREVIFFFRFFWRFFHFRLAPEIEIGNTWPPTNIIIFNPFQIPLLNTFILLRSGVTVTWSHHSILNKRYKSALFSLIITVILGIIFSYFQFLEYNWSLFSFNDCAFGRIFFITTGFHGIHVAIGTSFLFFNIYRLTKSHFNHIDHFSFEASAWYWHFVDIVWLYLFVFVYWWYYFLINIISIFNFQLKSFNKIRKRL